jgi:hypothetical protein
MQCKGVFLVECGSVDAIREGHEIEVKPDVLKSMFGWDVTREYVVSTIQVTTRCVNMV